MDKALMAQPAMKDTRIDRQYSTRLVGFDLRERRGPGFVAPLRDPVSRSPYRKRSPAAREARRRDEDTLGRS